MAIPHPKKINPEDDLGFGPQPVVKSQPLLNRDGSVNVKRKGHSLFNTADYYHNLITMNWGKFWLIILSGYLVVNLIFACIYLAIGSDSLYGTEGATGMDSFFNSFFFSAQPCLQLATGISVRGVW